MRNLKISVLIISVLTISLAGCKKEKQRPSGGGGGGGSDNTENCCICNENGLEIICDGDFDMQGESWDYWVDLLETNGCDCEPNTAGFNCETGNCVGVTSNAEYNSMTECQNDCTVSSDTYDCVDGNCNNVGSGGAYASFSDCQNDCGSGYLLFKDFSDNSLTSGGWTQYVVTSNPQPHQWEIGNFSGTNPYAVANGYDDPGSSDTELWLISPPINLTNTIQPVFSFRNASRYPGNALQILISFEYDGSSNPAQQGNWIDQTPIFVWDTNPNAFSWTNSGDVNFSPLNGTNNVRIAFKYTSTTSSAATWEVDDIIMEEQGSTSSGYNCVSGNCQSVSSGAQYGTLSECQAICAGGSSDCCDCTGIGFACEECCDGEFDMLGESWATWLSIFESSGCNCD